MKNDVEASIMTYCGTYASGVYFIRPPNNNNIDVYSISILLQNNPHRESRPRMCSIENGI